MHCFSPFPLPQIVRPAWDVGFSLPRSLDCLMVGASLCGLLKQEQTRFDQALTPLPRPSDQRNKRLAHPNNSNPHQTQTLLLPSHVFFVMQSFTAGLMRSLLILSNFNGIYVLVICCSVCYYPPPSALYNSHLAPCASKSNPHSSLAPSASGVH